MRILALDFETGGLTPGVDGLLQIGAALMEGGTVLDTFESLIAPPTHYKTGRVARNYNVVALEITGIKWSAIKAAPNAVAVCEKLAEWTRGHDAEYMPVVAFNSPFDHAWYSDLLWLASGWHPTIKGERQAFPPMLKGPWYDTRVLAWGLCEKYDLDTVSSHFGLSRDSSRHGALKDAILAGKVFHALAEYELKEAK